MLGRAAVFLAVLLASPAISQEAPDYVGSEACTGCHTEAAEAWRGSHHDLAWTLPEDGAVAADFGDSTFAHDGMTARFYLSEDGTHRIEVTEKDGVTSDYPVHSVAGIEPLQQYLLETEPGRLQSFDVVWDTEKGGWFHLYPEQDLPPRDGLHWTGPYKTWNARCAECHATGFDKNYDPGRRSYASTQVEIGVGCEACHGPGSAHVGWAETLETSQAAPETANYGFTVDFSDPEATVQQCATCHSRREAHFDGNPVPGTPYHDAFNLSLLRPGLYHADGQILDEVYVYGSFLQSKMYARGVACTDCHGAHDAELRAEGNAVCTQCHSPAGNPRFPTLTPGNYDSTEHHFHEAGSPAAQCKTCHMGEQVYMGNDWRADHSFRVPRPDLSATTGAPDACTTCHTDRNPDWAARQVETWYPDPAHRGPHYGTAFARGREDPVAAAGDLEAIAADTGQPGIVRATALWLLEGSNSPGAADRLEGLLEDPDPLVRAAAVGVQRMAPPQDSVTRLVALLDDPVRTVRIATARALLDAPVARFPDRIAANMRSAMADWQRSLGNRLDFPETHLVIGGISLTMRNFDAAVQAFREVVELDPQRVEAWTMIARIRAAMGAGPETVSGIVDEALAANPGDPGLAAMKAELDGVAAAPELLPPAE